MEKFKSLFKSSVPKLSSCRRNLRAERAPFAAAPFPPSVPGRVTYPSPPGDPTETSWKGIAAHRAAHSGQGKYLSCLEVATQPMGNVAGHPTRGTGREEGWLHASPRGWWALLLPPGATGHKDPRSAFLCAGLHQCWTISPACGGPCSHLTYYLAGEKNVFLAPQDISAYLNDLKERFVVTPMRFMKNIPHASLRGDGKQA